MPYISNETLIGAALLVVLILGYQYVPSSATTISNNANTISNVNTKSSKKKASKKNKKPSSSSPPPIAGPSKTAKESDRIALGQSAEKPNGAGAGAASGENNKGVSNNKVNKSKGGNNQKADKASLGDVNQEKIVSDRQQGNKPQPQAQAEPQQQQSQQQQQKKKSLAEKLLPKEPKTKVDDMLAPEDRPGQIARVMKVTSSSSSGSGSTNNNSNGTANPFAAISSQFTNRNQDDEEDKSEEEEEVNLANDHIDGKGKIDKFQDDYIPLSDDEPSGKTKSKSKSKSKTNDGWDVVTSKKKKSSTLNISDPFASQSTSLPLPSDLASRQQKKNAKKSEEKKAARANEEAERLRRLALHKKDLERERINELYAAKQSDSSRGKSLHTSNTPGSRATLTENGKLVWD
ncbi:uncharacterized protein IL334_002490 [Kwoniella shivajii]|uniref:INO80 complex subunit B-like conserved region domain-containing protein n=1 Tax=Kwoniella shivajii TaxID=564305 RepID=A0ABZ1CUW2_9TREE|nr:hypothetical protein IL334_002490 [Kwoniella shivajii]